MFQGLPAFLWRALLTAARMFAEAAPFLLAGLLIAGIIAGALRRDRIERRLGGPGLRPILLASFLGVPLPLCSCGVLPAAISLRRHGASRGATISFLVSTPETGVDSIAISYALLGPVIAIARPVAAFVTAVFAGMAVEWGGPRDSPPPAGPLAPAGNDAMHETSSRTSGIRRGYFHALDEILAEIGPWLLAGVLIAGLLAELLPADLFTRLPGGEIASMLVMLAVGVPLYICASASTPVAASLMEKGLSPGAALVFLLVGPATNVAAILVVTRELGRRVSAIYLAALAVLSILFGLALNAIWRGGVSFSTGPQPGELIPAPVSYGAAAILLVLIVWRTVGSRGGKPA